MLSGCLASGKVQGCFLSCPSPCSHNPTTYSSLGGSLSGIFFFYVDRVSHDIHSSSNAQTLVPCPAPTGVGDWACGLWTYY